MKLNPWSDITIIFSFESASIDSTGDLLTWYYKWEQDYLLQAAEATEDPGTQLINRLMILTKTVCG